MFNDRLFVSGTDIQALFDQLPVEDPGHAFYLGKELMKARLALLLGKTYVQEQPLRWGYLTPEREDNASPPGPDRGAAARAPLQAVLAPSLPQAPAQSR